MRKSIAIIIFMAICLSGCGNNTTTTNTTTETITETTTEATTEVPTTETPKVVATIKKKQVYNGNGVKITVTDLVNNNLFFDFENTSSKDLTTSIRAYAINGIMANCSWDTMETSLPANSKTENSLQIPDKVWQDDIEVIKSIKVQFWFFEDGSEIETTSPITIKTSAYDKKNDKIEYEKVKESNGNVYGLVNKSNQSATFLIKNKNKSWYSYTLTSLVMDGKAYDGNCDELGCLDEVVFPNCVLPIRISLTTDYMGQFCIKNGIDNPKMTLGIDEYPKGDYYNYSSSKVVLK